ncbi:hypothetical protein H7J07_03900 [Mycobacterium koreense]|uniref:Uncharacterized protein n=1 Tax=Mycolicibacillus koreensis TaxID=1069220 RepID=A0A7I7SJG0_9MYCO|nr:hypothetical protein [Mycolicibacillus koreensis]MCV7247400.1 hypothetical protein [Mycolicibacillus koreensis]OSC34468.1 hypothetical protein B8W67_06955 [Mycolicibacillus koreensis]BBY56591.1 hypothetical protein MKOR_38420 [Mycolicibacillus koreensis]
MKKTIEWHDGLVANPDQVTALAEELAVSVTIRRSSTVDPRTGSPVPYELVAVTDPASLRGEAFALSGKRFLPDHKVCNRYI